MPAKKSIKSKLAQLKSKITSKGRSSKKTAGSKRVSTIHLVGNKKSPSGRSSYANR